MIRFVENNSIVKGIPKPLVYIIFAAGGFWITFGLFYLFNPVVIVFTGILVLLTVIGLRNISYGVYVILIVLPFIDFFKRALFITSVTKVEYFLVKSLPDLIPILLLLHLVGNREYRTINNLLDKVLLLFTIWISLESVNPRIPILVGFGGIHLYIIPLLTYFYTKKMVTESDNLSTAFRIIFITAVVTSLYGLYHGFIGMTTFEKTWVSSQMVSPAKADMITIRDYLRAFSTFTSHKEFGFSLIVSMMVTLIALKKINLFSKLASLMLMATALVLTFHRASLLALIFGILVYTLHHFRRSISVNVCYFVILLSPVAVPTIGTWIVGIGKLFSGNPILYALFHTGTFEGRIRGFERAFANTSELIDPIGHGLGSIWVGKRIANITQAIQVPHNGYLEMLWEIGSVGTLIFIIVVISTLRIGYKVMLAEDNDELRRIGNLSVGICAGILLTHGLINSFTQMYHTAVYYWFFTGVLSGVHDRIYANGLNSESGEGTG